MVKPTDKQVRLRVAGLFYDDTFELSKINMRADGTMTIENVMDYARLTTHLDYGFEYRAAALGKKGTLAIKSMIQIANSIEKGFTSLGGKERNGGVYRLIETPIPAGVVAWQYYVIGINGVTKSTNKRDDIVSPSRPLELIETPPRTANFTPYDEVTVQGGDTIIWRMVAICTNPAAAQPKPEKSASY